MPKVLKTRDFSPSHASVKMHPPIVDAEKGLKLTAVIPFVLVCPDLQDKKSREKIFQQLGIDSWAPSHKTDGSACADFRAASTVTIPPGKFRAIPTGIACQLPKGFELSARSRSGLFVRNQILVVGTIDDDYRGEIKILLANFGEEDFKVKFGDRIAQFKLSSYVRQDWELVESLNATSRGNKGFGHTGIQ